jgi:hypothetical protein
VQGPQGNQGFQGLGGGLQGPQGVQGVAGNTNSYAEVTNDPNTVLLLHGNGTNNSTTITDSSYSPKTLTAVGNAKISTTTSKFGVSSIAFDGSGDYLSVPYDSDFNFAATTWTFELWFRANSFSTAMTVMGKHTSGVDLDYQIDIMSTTSIRFAYTKNPNFIYAAVPAMSVDTWYHLAAVKDASGFSIYLNGTRYLGPTAISIPNNIGNNVIIGASSWNIPQGFFNGYMDDIRLSKVARYSGASFTVPSAEFTDATPSPTLPSNPSVGTVVHTDNGAYACSSTSPVTWKKYVKVPNTFSVTNVTETVNTSNAPARYTQVDASDFLAWRLDESPGSTTFVSSVNPGASTNLTIGSTSKFRSGIDEGLFQRTVTFQGNADAQERYLRGAAAVVPSSSTSFSASAWIIPYSNALGAYSADPYIFGKYWHASSSWTSPYLGVYMGLNGAGGWGGGLYINGVGLVTFSARTPLALNYPHLLAVTYDGNFIRLYQNGFLAGISSNYNGAAASYGSGPWYSGKAPVGFPGHSFDGQVWDIRVANTVRTEAYYRNMYLNGTARWG